MIQDLTVSILFLQSHTAQKDGILWEISLLKCVWLCYHLQDKVAHLAITMDVHFHGEFKIVSAPWRTPDFKIDLEIKRCKLVLGNVESVLNNLFSTHSHCSNNIPH